MTQDHEETAISVLKNIKSIKDAIGVINAIDKHRGELADTHHSHFFALMRKFSYDSAINSTCKIYDDTNERYPKHTIHKMLKNWGNKYPEDARLKEIKATLPKKEKDSPLQKIFTLRNKAIAHQEDLKGLRETILPQDITPKEIEAINEISLEIANEYLERIDRPIHLICNSRMATLNVIYKILGKEFKPGSEEFWEFYREPMVAPSNDVDNSPRHKGAV